jgi:hypothetical protein
VFNPSVQNVQHFLLGRLGDARRTGFLMEWLAYLSWASLAVGFACAGVIVLDILMGHPQHMGIMNVVWPITALYSGPLGLLAEYRLGRQSTRHRVHLAREWGEEPPGKRKPFWRQLAVAATHCGSGCTLGDIIAEWMMVAVPFELFGRRLYAAWVVDFAWAYVLGVVFQYFTIAPMRQLSVGKGILAAVRADTLSLTAWQVGMYGWMTIAVFLIFHRELKPTEPVFWFMMQLGMLCGFLTAYPVNWLLLRAGWKEPM